MQRLIEFMDHYLLRSLIPFVIVLSISIGVLLAVLYGVSIVESRMQRTTPFDLEIGQLRFPFWLALSAGLLVLDGVKIGQAKLAEARLERREEKSGWAFSAPPPLGGILAASTVYCGCAIFAFYALRPFLCKAF